jgi:MFS family permease
MMAMKLRLPISRTVLLLGLVSLLNDLAGELIMAVLPVFLIGLPGSGGWVIGLIGGLEDGARSLLSFAFGHWADRQGRKKPFILWGYFIPAVFRIALPFSTHWSIAMTFRIMDRLGKGLRTAPRDALIADAVTEETRGVNFGFHRALDTAGALIGSLLAFVLFWMLGFDLQGVILVGGLVSLSSLIPLFFVPDTRRRPNQQTLAASMAGLPRTFYLNLLPMAFFALANFSYMLFLLKVNDSFTDKLAVGLPILMYILYNFVYTACAFPAGLLSDRIGRRRVLMIGYALFALVCLGFAQASELEIFIPLFALYGLAYALTESNQRAFVADFAPPELRATAMGLFQLAVGIATFSGSTIAGLLWGGAGETHALTFYYGSLMAGLGLALFWVLSRFGLRAPAA